MDDMIVARIEPLVEDLLIFRFKISFLTLFVVTVSKSKPLMLISRKSFLIFLVLIWSSNSEAMPFKSFAVHSLEDYKSKFSVILIKKLFIIVAISFSFVFANSKIKSFSWDVIIFG